MRTTSAGRLTRHSVLVAAAIGLAGCGTTAAPRGTPSSMTVTTGASATSASGAFPVEVMRRGGIAGFNDRLTIAADGRTSGSFLGKTVDCAVAPAIATALADGAAQNLRAPDHVKDGSDAMSITVSNSAGNSDLGDGTGPDAVTATVLNLIDDLSRSPGERTVCR